MAGSATDSKIVSTLEVLSGPTCFRDAAEQKELELATALPKESLICFQPERLAWHEDIIAVSTRVQVKNEDDLLKKSLQLYTQALEDIMTASKELKSRRLQKEKEFIAILKEVKNGKLLQPERRFATEMQKKYAELQERQPKLGAHFSGYDTNQAIIAYFTDLAYNDSAKAIMLSLMARQLTVALYSRRDEFLPITEPGAFFSGKAQAGTKLRARAEYPQLTQEEVAIINKEVAERISKIIKPTTDLTAEKNSNKKLGAG